MVEMSKSLVTILAHAAKAGANSVKFQIVCSPALTLPVIWEAGNAFQNDLFGQQTTYSIHR